MAAAEQLVAFADRVVATRRLSDFDPSRNGITMTRLCLAITVIVSHSFAIGGFGLEPLVAESRDTTSLGFTAVLAFFALSGFLLARSRERTSLLPFLRNRALRIIPGYWLSLLFVALVAAPIAAQVSRTRLDPADVVAYVVPRLAFVPETASTSLRHAFDGAVINGSLWTLGVECLCYLFLAFIPRRYLQPVAIGEVAMLTILWLVAPTLRGPDTALMLSFALGVCAWLGRRRVPVSISAAGVAAVVAVAGVRLGLLPLLTLGIAYLALISAWLPLHVSVDLSYGTYVLAYPITTVLVMAGARSFGVLGLATATVLIVLPLAALSWTFVERPALGLRARTQPATAGTSRGRTARAPSS